MQKYLGLQICIDLQKNCKICRRRDMTTIQKEKSDPEMLFFHSAQWRGYCVFLCITVCSCVLPRVTVCYHVLLCATVCFCVLLCVTVCFCVLLCATVCYFVLLCVTAKLCLEKWNMWTWKVPPSLQLLEWKVLHRVLMDHHHHKKWKQRQNANFCDNGMSKNTSRNVSYWVRLGVAKMGLAKKRAKKSWRQLNLGRTEKRLDMIDPRDLQRWLAPI